MAWHCFPKITDTAATCVTDRLVSDVPLGTFLSGGIDSSAIVALMQKTASQPVKTYAIGFEDAGYNEAPMAAKIAAHLGTEHHEQLCTQKDALALIPRLPEIYERLLRKWPDGMYQKDLSLPNVDLSFAEKMMFWDTTGYLPHDILTKVDRASMAVGLEARAPLLDIRIFEYVWSLPESMRIRGAMSKWLLRQILGRHVLEKLFTRPKQGFNMPVGDWLRGDLRDWAESLLDEKRLNAQGLLDAPSVRKIWQAHLDG